MEGSVDYPLGAVAQRHYERTVRPQAATLRVVSGVLIAFGGVALILASNLPSSARGKDLLYLFSIPIFALGIFAAWAGRKTVTNGGPPTSLRILASGPVLEFGPGSVFELDWTKPRFRLDLFDRRGLSTQDARDVPGIIGRGDVSFGVPGEVLDAVKAGARTHGLKLREWDVNLPRVGTLHRAEITLADPVQGT